MEWHKYSTAENKLLLQEFLDGDMVLPEQLLWYTDLEEPA